MAIIDQHAAADRLLKDMERGDADNFLCMLAIAGMKAHPCNGDVQRLRELARQLRDAAESADGAADGLIAECYAVEVEP